MVIHSNGGKSQIANSRLATVITTNNHNYISNTFVSPYADKLMIVAHPDDEVLWGGGNLLSSHGWHVVVSTHNKPPNADHVDHAYQSTRYKSNKINKSSVRYIEFHKTMSLTGVLSCEMHSVRDKYTENIQVAEELYHGSIEYPNAFEKRIHELADMKKWKVVMTHNVKGEYGHAHHKTVHKIVTDAFGRIHKSVKHFSDKGSMLSPNLLIAKKQLNVFYANTQTISRLAIESIKGVPLESSYERDHINNEILYVVDSEKKQMTIPKIVHQVWFGKSPPPWREYIFETNRRATAKNKVEYRLWTMKDFTFENFPLTWKSIHKALHTSKKTGVSRWAQVVDFARLEIIYRHGGAYCDALFEITPKFWRAVAKANREGATMIVANEDPCGLTCKGSNGNYISNGFFASIPRHDVLGRLLLKVEACNIDFKNKHINQTSGPYFFRSGIIDATNDKIALLDTLKIYPLMVNDSDYREATPNECILDKSDLNRMCIKGKVIKQDAIRVDEYRYLLKDCAKKMYPKALTVYHSGLGGTWSWMK